MASGSDRHGAGWRRIRSRLRTRRGGGDKFFALAHAGLRSLFRLVAAVLIARLASADVFAAYIALTALEVIVTAVPNAWFLAPLGSIGPGLPAAQRLGFYAAMTRRHNLWSVVLGGVVFGALHLGPSIPGLTANGIAYFTLCTVVTGMANGVRAREQARFRARRVLFGDGVVAVLTLAITWMRGDSDARVLSTFFGVQALTTAVAVVWWNRLGAKLAAPSRALGRAQHMGARVALGSVANSASSRVQPFVLAAVGGALAVNSFGAAMRLVGPVRLLAMALAGVLRPRLALHAGRSDPSAARRALATGVLAILAAGAAVLIPLQIAGEALAVMVFGPGFEACGRVAPVAALYAVLEAIGALLVVAVHTMHPDGAAIATTRRISVGVLGLLAVWPACAYAGPAGACWALIAVELVFVAWLGRCLEADPLRSSRAWGERVREAGRS